MAYRSRSRTRRRGRKGRSKLMSRFKPMRQRLGFRR